MNLNIRSPWIYFWITFLLLDNSQFEQVAATPGCAFHTLDGVAAESEGVRFIRLREDAMIGKEILWLRAYPRSSIGLKSVDGTGDHKFFSVIEVNTTTVAIKLARSLEDLVDRDIPKNLLKFRIVCAGKNEKIAEARYMSITVYIEDVNDNAPEFLNTPYIIDVDENTPPGTIIFESIQAFDRDKPNTPNSEVHFSMSTVPEQLSPDGSPFFALKSPHRPLLVLKRELDFDNGIRLFKLPLFAWDRGTPANQVNTTITINVRDVDDLPPKFTEGVYRTKINEFYPMTGIPVRVPLYFSPPIMAFDQDSLNATLVYDIISGNERKLFRVNPNNGIIYLQKEIDLEEESLPGNTFVLQIEARQRENPLKKALARIEVEILDLNDNVPEFEADFYNISIVENLPSGFSVLQVNAIDRDQGENSEFIYNLIEEPSSGGAFRIDSRSGWITVRDDRLLDREKRKSIQLVVEAIERNPPFLVDKNMHKVKPNSVKVEITLLDTNDNTPKFEDGNLYEFKVAITSPVGYKIGQVKAIDPDEGPNGMLLYELQRPKGSGYIPFQLDSKNGSVYVSGPLRRGRIAVFVEASDQPTNPSERRFSLAVITIEVYATIDDQAIDFVGAPYEFWIGSHAPLGTSVGQVRTTLIYDGEEEIMYDLLHTYSEGVPFAIEERSGIITVIRELQEFKRKTYHFEAVANYLFANSSQALLMSRSSQPLTTMPATDLTDEGVLITNVTIHVITKPENRIPLRPVIEEINMNIITFHVEENLAGAVIGQLLYKNGINIVNNELGTFRDLQEPSNVSTIGIRFHSRNQHPQPRRRIPRRLIADSNIKLRYIIANQQEVVNKITITEDGTLLTLTALDREQQSNYDLTVIVEYSTGLMSGAGIYQVNIQVDDVNDNAPKFNTHTFIGLITENSASGNEVSLSQPIQITDADEGINAKFRVVLQGDYNDMFTISYSNGSAELPNEINRHNFANVEIFNVFNLTDQWNDEMQLSELQSSMKTNTGPHFRITYNGKRPLDREKDQIYNLKIVAVDSGGLSTIASFTILVADVNDNAPIFERISVFKDAKVEIREYTTDMEIYFVESSSSALSALQTTVVLPPYHIPGSPRLNTDAMTFNSTSFTDTSMHHRLRPRSRGRSRIRISRASTLRVKCPLFAVLEDTPLTTKVLQVTASDEDFGRNAQVHYEIVAEHVDRPAGFQFVDKAPGAHHLAIDKLTGEVIVNYPFAAKIDILLNISATDIDGLKDTTCLRFTVIDVNNHAPVFKKSSYSFDAEEGFYNGSVLGQILAMDLDYGENANITYSLSDQEIPFTIKPWSGILKIKGALDREVRAKYNFHVIARDNADPLLRLSSSVEVEVNVLDVNDNKPEFIGYDDLMKAHLFTDDVVDKTLMLPIYKAYLDRSTSPGMFVKQVNAIDKDYVGNGNGLVLYSILHQNIHSPIFQIDSRDGTIKTVGSFKGFNDYEHLNVTVIASDLGSPAHSSTAVLLINLQGQAVTEPMPTVEVSLEPVINSYFQHQYYEVQVSENNEPPTELIKINLTDQAMTETYHWSFSVEQSVVIASEIESYFEIDSKNGLLSASKSFDRETIPRYKLRVRVDKSNREPRTYTKLAYPVIDERIDGLDLNECRIVINVLDENDNSPKFKGNGRPIIAVVPRLATFGYPVTTVEASDADEGFNAEIRYRLLNEHAHIFSIDESTGKIRLVSNVPNDERVYGFDVKATDRLGADDGRSNIVNVFVYVIDETRQVRLVLAGMPLDVEQKIDALTQILSEAIQMDVRVRLLEPHAGRPEPATDAYLYAVDYRTNSMLEMEQFHNSLAGLQLDALQLIQKQKFGDKDYRPMPRILELAEFGQPPRNSQKSALPMSGAEIISVVLIVLCVLGAGMTALCFLCLRQKRDVVWSQQEFPTSETGLTYTIAHTGNDSCRQHHHRHHQQRKCSKSNQTNSTLIPESICSSAPSQSTELVTAVAAQKLEQQQLQQHHNQLQHPHHHHHHHHQHHQQKQHLQQSNTDQRPREYIDVPLPKSVAKAVASRAASLDTQQPPSFMLKYNACQPINNHLTNPYESSMFSLHSSGQDSGVEFLSNRDLYETSPDSFNNSQTTQKSIIRDQVLCPRHAIEHVAKMRNNNNNSNESRNNTESNQLSATETCSSDNYEESLKTSEAVTASPASIVNGICQRHRQHAYQNTKFEKRSCTRHSFSGVKDDLMQNSPQISLRPRGHLLRNSMNDLQERLHNLEQSFRQPKSYAKSNSIY